MICDVEAAARLARMARQLALDRAGVADEQQPDLQVTRGDERAVDDDRRARVAAHGVDGYAHHSRVRSLPACEQSVQSGRSARLPRLRAADGR